MLRCEEYNQVAVANGLNNAPCRCWLRDRLGNGSSMVTRLYVVIEHSCTVPAQCSTDTWIGAQRVVRTTVGIGAAASSAALHASGLD